MSTQVELLAALQQVDRSLRTNTQAVDQGRARVNELSLQLEAKGAELEAARATLETLESRQRDLEGRLAEIETKTKDRRMRIARIRNDKELGLLRREVELLKEETGTVETELLTIMERLDVAREAVAEAEAEHRALSEQREAESGALDETISRVASAIQQDKSRRGELLENVDGDLHRRYELIFSRRDGLAVVEVRAGTCQGCHMNLPPQLFNQIQRNDEVLLCPSCQRILYWQPGADD